MNNVNWKKWLTFLGMMILTALTISLISALFTFKYDQEHRECGNFQLWQYQANQVPARCFGFLERRGQ